jgi:dihydropyrimidine dehydrogenase (NAD+) subunit PreA
MVDLSTTYMGVPIKNPLIVGSGPTTATPQICEKAAQYGWSAVVLKTNFSSDVVETIFTDPQVPYRIPRPYVKLVDSRGMDRWRPPKPEATMSRTATGRLGRIPGDYMLALMSQASTSPLRYYAVPLNWYNGEKYPFYIEKTKQLVKHYNCKVIASILSLTEKGWEHQCNMINNSNADMVELDMSAHAAVIKDPRTEKHMIMGESPEIVEKWTAFCVRRIKIPVGVKLPAYCPDPMASVQAAIRRGAKGIQFASLPTYQPPIPPIVIDPDTLELGFGSGNPFKAAASQLWSVPYICGPIVHFRVNGTEVDISGCGGVREFRDILRLIMAGASSVQVCTATLVEGVEVVSGYLQDIQVWMEQKNYNSIKEIQGIIADKEKLKSDPSKFVADVAQVAGGPTPKFRIQLDKSRCNDCRWCEACCFHLAIKMENKIPVVDDSLCEICGMCVAICPTEALGIVTK